MNSTSSRFFILLLAVSATACQQRPDLGKALSREFKNPALKHLSPEDVAPFLEKKLQSKENNIDTKTSELLAAGYRDNSYAPVFLQRYLPGNGIKLLLEHIGKAGEHGLDPAMFQPERLRQLMDTLQHNPSLSAPEAAAELVADLELRLAISLTTYSNALIFGVTDPANVYPRYYMDTRRPDSISMARLFHAPSPEAWLDSIQPAHPEYLLLQKELARLEEPVREPAKNTAGGDTADGVTAGNSGTSDEADSLSRLRQTLMVNLERLRWKNQSDTGKYVVVNIAAYRLFVMDKRKPVLEMKVCVGEPARRWQTPQLNSMIERVQVNPVWNIPESIAAREIMTHASADPYYLENAGIDVYRSGEKMEDTREIDWNDVIAENSAYRFKQRPGSKNALGKIKFLFDNQSSVYLHDTPAKAAFDREIRAVSHGCVRVEKPLELARALFGEGSKFEQVKTEMGKENPEARNIELPERVPVYLVYYTCRAGKNGGLQIYPDTYGLDKLVLKGLKAATPSIAARL